MGGFCLRSAIDQCSPASATAGENGSLHASGNNVRDPELSKQADKHLIRGAKFGKPCPPQLAAITKHIVIPAKDKIGELTVTQPHDVSLNQLFFFRQGMPCPAVIAEKLLK